MELVREATCGVRFVNPLIRVNRFVNEATCGVRLVNDWTVHMALVR